MLLRFIRKILLSRQQRQSTSEVLMIANNERERLNRQQEGIKELKEREKLMEMLYCELEDNYEWREDLDG